MEEYKRRLEFRVYEMFPKSNCMYYNIPNDRKYEKGGERMAKSTDTLKGMVAAANSFRNLPPYVHRHSYLLKKESRQLSGVTSYLRILKNTQDKKRKK